MSTPIIPKRKTMRQRLTKSCLIGAVVGAICSSMCMSLWWYVGMFTTAPIINMVYLAAVMFAIGFMMMFLIMFQGQGESIEEFTYRRRLNAARNFFVNKEQYEADVKAMGAAAEELIAERGKDNVTDRLVIERVIDKARVK